MRASTPSIETRSEGTLDCHTDAILLREGAGAACPTYLRGSSAGVSALPSGTSVSLSVGTPTTASEPPPFAVARSVFPAAKLAIVVGPGPATVRARARARDRLVRPNRAERRAAAVAPARRARGASAITGAGAFALGATTAASVGQLTGGALETAALSCIVAGVVMLLVALARTREGTRLAANAVPR